MAVTAGQDGGHRSLPGFQVFIWAAQTDFVQPLRCRPARPAAAIVPAVPIWDRPHDDRPPTVRKSEVGDTLLKLSTISVLLIDL